jgi:hypothetical protein
MDIHAAFGIAAGIVSILGYVPYILSTIRGKTKPNRASWWIWTAVGIVIAASYYSVGARDTLWLVLASSVFGPLIMAVLSFRYGEGGLTPFDRACLASSATGIFLWWFFSTPALALFMGITSDAIGYLPTMRKAWHNPLSEDKLTWLMFWAGGMLSLFAITTWSVEMAAYPLYFCVFPGLMAAILSRKKTGMKNTK